MTPFELISQPIARLDNVAHSHAELDWMLEAEAAWACAQLGEPSRAEGYLENATRRAAEDKESGPVLELYRRRVAGTAAESPAKALATASWVLAGAQRLTPCRNSPTQPPAAALAVGMDKGRLDVSGVSDWPVYRARIGGLGRLAPCLDAFSNTLRHRDLAVSNRYARLHVYDRWIHAVVVAMRWKDERIVPASPHAALERLEALVRTVDRFRASQLGDDPAKTWRLLALELAWAWAKLGELDHAKGLSEPALAQLDDAVGRSLAALYAERLTEAGVGQRLEQPPPLPRDESYVLNQVIDRSQVLSPDARADARSQFTHAIGAVPKDEEPVRSKVEVRDAAEALERFWSSPQPPGAYDELYRSNLRALAAVGFDELAKAQWLHHQLWPWAADWYSASQTHWSLTALSFVDSEAYAIATAAR